MAAAHPAVRRGVACVPASSFQVQANQSMCCGCPSPGASSPSGQAVTSGPVCSSRRACLPWRFGLAHRKERNGSDPSSWVHRLSLAVLLSGGRDRARAHCHTVTVGMCTSRPCSRVGPCHGGLFRSKWANTVPDGSRLGSRHVRKEGVTKGTDTWKHDPGKRLPSSPLWIPDK